MRHRGVTEQSHRSISLCGLIGDCSTQISFGARTLTAGESTLSFTVHMCSYNSLRGINLGQTCTARLSPELQCPAFADGRIHELHLRELRYARGYWSADWAARRSGSIHWFQR